MSTELTAYFGDRADDYARYRPSYPADAVAWALDGLPTPARAADVGCGTGIATRILADLGADVVGVEPNAAMRAEAEAAGPPGVRYVEGTGEATGLGTASLDLVLCAQAFHWFDAETALAEFHRILKPGGRLALMWNVRQTDVGFGVPYGESTNRAKADARARGRILRNARSADPGVPGAAGRWFTNQRKRGFPNDQRVTRETLLGRARSASYFPPPDHPLHAELSRFLLEQFDAHQQDDAVVLPQVAEVTLCDRVAPP